VVDALNMQWQCSKLVLMLLVCCPQQKKILPGAGYKSDVVLLSRILESKNVVYTTINQCGVKLCSVKVVVWLAFWKGKNCYFPEAKKFQLQSMH